MCQGDHSQYGATSAACAGRCGDSSAYARLAVCGHYTGWQQVGHLEYPDHCRTAGLPDIHARWVLVLLLLLCSALLTDTCPLVEQLQLPTTSRPFTMHTYAKSHTHAWLKLQGVSA